MRSSSRVVDAPSSGSAAARPIGTVNPNVLPTPTSLSSHIRPPISPTMRRHSVRPRPVPSCVGRAAAALLERLEDPLAVLRCDTDAGVGHGDDHVVTVDPRRRR